MDTLPPLVTTPTPAPALWNPNAAACWCLLLSPAFGAFLHARNAEALGRTAEAKANMGWFYAALGFLGINLLTLFVPAIPDSLLRLVGLVMLLTWYFTLGKKQLQFVKSTWGNQYPRKPWKKPLLIGFGCFVAYLVVGIVIAVIAELLFGIK